MVQMTMSNPAIAERVSGTASRTSRATIDAPGETLSAMGAGADTFAVRVWLATVAALIFAMVVVGGATRLTDSGLSITEWKPLLGAIPPLNAADWQIAFDKYRQIPEYQQINRGMSLAEFQFIYWWEWAHRQLGRFIGLAFAIPLVVFWAMGRIPHGLGPRLVGLLALGGLQGFVGWYMVQSGLSDRVDVSQYRLALHLTLALVIFGLIVWTIYGLTPQASSAAPAADDETLLKRDGDRPGSLLIALAALGVVLVYLQTVLGAFVAGLKAGLSHNTWPLMDGQWVPSGLFVKEPAWLNLFENVMTVQFNHRMLAYAIGAWALLHALAVWRFAGAGARQRWSALAVVAVIALQMAIGIWTLLAQVPISLGLLHQGGIVIVIAVLLWHLSTLVHHPARIG